MSTEFNIPQVLPFIGPSAFEIVLQQIVDILNLEEPNLRLQAVNQGKAQGTLTLAVQPTDGNTITVDTKTYIFQDTLVNADGNIQIGSDLATTQSNLVAAFDLSGVGGTDYAALMTAHPTVDIAAFSNNEAVLTAQVSGAASDNITTTSVFSDAENFFDDTTLGATRPGADIDEADFAFNTVKQISNPFTSFQEFITPKVNVLFKKTDLKSRSNVDVTSSVIYVLEVYAESASTEVEDGMTASAIIVNRVMGQIFRVLKSPKYVNLRLSYKNEQGILVKFIEKLSVLSLESVFPKEPFAKESVTAGLITIQIDMIESLPDVLGTQLEIINVLLEDPTT